MSVGFRKSARSSGIWPRILAALTAVIAIAAVAGWWRWVHWAPSPDEYPVQGVVISSNLGEVDWISLRSHGADFAYIRATSGPDLRDPGFARNWADARQAGLRYGAELVYDPCRLASDQATLFVTTVPRDNAALPPAIRLGAPPACATDRDHMLSALNTLINLVEAHSGKPAILHVSKSYEQAFDITSEINRTFWLDGDFFPPDYTARPWVMWSVSTVRRIDRINGPVEWVAVAP